MDFSKGIPASSRTLVVVPTLLTSIEGIDELVEALEVRFLANRDENLRFGLLTDFADAAAETMPDDAALLEHARQRIETLNETYGNGGIVLSVSPSAPLESARARLDGQSNASGASSPTSTGCCASPSPSRMRPSGSR